jgi:hypothetical protein
MAELDVSRYYRAEKLHCTIAINCTAFETAQTEVDPGSRTGRYVVVMLLAALRATVRVDHVHDQAACFLTVSPLIFVFLNG